MPYHVLSSISFSTGKFANLADGSAVVQVMWSLISSTLIYSRRGVWVRACGGCVGVDVVGAVLRASVDGAIYAEGCEV